MHSPQINLSAVQYTRWTFHPRLPFYVTKGNQPFDVVSIYERNGAEFVQHQFIYLN